MRIAVIGAGVSGLTAARRLALSGHRVDVYERWPGLGGQVATLEVGDGDRLERYYHHLFTSDVHIAQLYEELGMGSDLRWEPSSVAIFAHGRSHPFTTPIDLLRFSPLSLRSRLRMGLAVLRIHRGSGALEDFEETTAGEWIRREMGQEVWDTVWGPLLRGKFGSRADEISMGWLWSKLTVRRQIRGREARRELLGYPRGGWEPLLLRLRDEIEASSGRVMINCPAARLTVADGSLAVVPGAPESFRRGHDPGLFDPAGRPQPYDTVLATVPSDVFDGLMDGSVRTALGPQYLGRLRSAEYHTALCVLLEMDRTFSPFYWTNVADPELPFVGLIEHTNLVDPGRYGGHRYLYVANYLAPGDPLLELSHEELLDHYEPGLRRVNPEFERSWIRRSWSFREPAAQPIVTVGYRGRIPAMATPIPGLFLANTTQIYPEDRGTNYSVRLGEEAASLIDGASQRPLAGAEPSRRG